MAVLGGPRIEVGREHEALLIWQGLHVRAAQGDVASSEDLTTLTFMVAYHPFVAARPGLAEALAESALDAAVLPRHKIELLGLLVRLGVGRGDRARALRYLSWIAPEGWELEADSAFRVSAAAVVTLDRDARRVLELVGMRRDAIPIADSLDPLASILRANAYELLGDLATAEHILSELPDPALLDLIRARFSVVRLCERAGHAFAERAKRDGAQRAAKNAGDQGRRLGRGLLLSGIPCIVLPLVTRGPMGGHWSSGTLIACAMGALLTAVGGALLLHARGAEARATRLWNSGVELRARVIAAQPTGTSVNGVPVVELSLRVEGPRGPYDAKAKRRVATHELASLVGVEVRVRADPDKLEDLVLDARC
jgi:hypothetical protein